MGTLPPAFLFPFSNSYSPRTHRICLIQKPFSLARGWRVGRVMVGRIRMLQDAADAPLQLRYSQNPSDRQLSCGSGGTNW
jgi:hypothetical protein